MSLNQLAHLEQPTWLGLRIDSTEKEVVKHEFIFVLHWLQLRLSASEGVAVFLAVLLHLQSSSIALALTFGCTTFIRKSSQKQTAQTVQARTQSMKTDHILEAILVLIDLLLAIWSSRWLSQLSFLRKFLLILLFGLAGNTRHIELSCSFVRDFVAVQDYAHGRSSSLFSLFKR